MMKKILRPTFPLLGTLIAIVLVVGCGEAKSPSSSDADTSANASPSAETYPDSSLHRRFKDAVEDYHTSQWSTWESGESISQCFIANAASMTTEAKEAVIESGIEAPFDKLTGAHLESLSQVWNLCESLATSSSAPSLGATPSATKPTSSNAMTSVPQQMLDFESTADHQGFSEAIQERFQSAVDEQFDTATDKAGISVAVYQGGYLWRYAKGEANSREKMTAGTPILIRSTSKVFLAGLVLQQIDSGLYSLSTTVGSALAGDMGYQAFDKNVINPDVTVEQLLTMTSGIKQVTSSSTPAYTALQNLKNWRPSEVVQLVDTRFTPPGTYEYSNTNSILLGMIAEHVSNQQLNELYESFLSDRLGIVMVLLPQDTAPPDTARPHADRSMFGGTGTGFGDIMELSHHGSDWYQATNKTTWAAAGVVSTPENVARWAYELLSNQGSALSPATRAKLVESFDGPSIAIGGPEPKHQYGYHMTRTTVPLSGTSITAYGHPGMGAGYTSDLFYSPELDMAISLVANSHSDARSRTEAQGHITHQILGQIAQQIFESYEAR